MLQLVFHDLQHLLISMARSFKYFYNVLTHLTKFKHFESSTCSHVHIQSNDTCGQHEAGEWIWTCEHVEDPKGLKFFQILLILICPNKDPFWFLLMLRTSSAEVWREKNFAGKYKFLSPQYSYRGVYGCKWKMKGFNENFHLFWV